MKSFRFTINAPKPKPPPLKRRKIQRTRIPHALLTAFFTSLAVVNGIQAYQQFSVFLEKYPVFFPAMLFSAVLLWLVMSALMLITRGVTLGIMLPATFVILLSIVNHYKLIYLGIPLFPTDFSLLGNGMHMLSVIDAHILVNLLIALTVLFAAALILRVFLPPLGGRAARRVAAGILFAAVSLILILDLFSVRTNIFKISGVHDRSANQVQNYSDNGLIAGLLLNLETSVIDKPDGYGEEIMRLIGSGYKTAPAASNENPHIIFILNESFSDPYNLSEDFTVNSDPIPFFRSLTEKNYTASIMTPQIGSKTSNVEFELLTSVGMRDIYQKSVLYQDNLQYKDNIWSILRLLDRRGYEKTAVHPYNRTFYKRNEVYTRMGFDRFLAEEDIKSDDRLCNNPYIPDIAVYKDVAGIIKSSDTPQFFHIVTMQNHAPYTQNLYSEHNFKTEGIVNDSVREEYETYFQGLAYSDDALKWFTEELTASGKRCVIVFYGDHQPYMAKMLSSDAGAADDPSLISEPRYYKTPLAIIDTGKSSKTLSDSEILSPFYITPLLFSYLGFELHPYYNFLLQMKNELPVCERKFLFDKHGIPVKNLSDIQRRFLEQYNLIAYDFLEGNEFLNFENNWLM